MKKLINAPDEVLTDALAGVAAAHPALSVNIPERYIVRAGGPTPGKVSLVSGGGSGHEPLHGGYVGYGMLDAACPGEVFTSPVPDRILAATRAVNAGAGVLYIVKNYTGDVLNFQMAARLAAVGGMRVETVLVNDDVAVDNTWTAGRRGTGATVLVEKIAGAASGSPAAWSATTSPAWTWPAARSPCAGSPRGSPSSGTIRWTPRRCAGAAQPTCGRCQLPSLREGHGTAPAGVSPAVLAIVVASARTTSTVEAAPGSSWPTVRAPM